MHLGVAYTAAAVCRRLTATGRGRGRPAPVATGAAIEWCGGGQMGLYIMPICANGPAASRDAVVAAATAALARLAAAAA